VLGGGTMCTLLGGGDCVHPGGGAMVLAHLMGHAQLRQVRGRGGVGVGG
jgi:hypothetical protein